MRGTHITCYHALSIVSKRLVYIGDPRKNITLCLLPDGGQMLSREEGEEEGGYSCTQFLDSDNFPLARNSAPSLRKLIGYLGCAFALPLRYL